MFLQTGPLFPWAQVEYRTAWTGLCKPRGARTARVIALVPQMGSATVWGAASVAVTVPAGVTAGQQLQVQTPAGAPAVKGRLGEVGEVNVNVNPLLRGV